MVSMHLPGQVPGRCRVAVYVMGDALVVVLLWWQVGAEPLGEGCPDWLWQFDENLILTGRDYAPARACLGNVPNDRAAMTGGPNFNGPVCCRGEGLGNACATLGTGPRAEGGSVLGKFMPYGFAPVIVGVGPGITVV